MTTRYLNQLGEIEEAPTVTAEPREWYEKIFDIIPAVAAYQGQRDLVKANVELAKAGKPLLDASAVSPQVNVGVSRDMQRLATFAVAGMVIVGLVFALNRKR